MILQPEQYETYVVTHFNFITHEGFKFSTSLVEGKDSLKETAEGFEIRYGESGAETFVQKPVFIVQRTKQEMKKRVKRPGECLVCDQPAKETSRFCKQHEKDN